MLIIQRRPEDAIAIAYDGLLKSTDRCGALMYNLNVALRQVGRIDEALNLSWQQLADLPGAMQKHLIDPPLDVKSFHTEFAIVVVKWGVKYDSKYVNNLYRAVMRHTPEETRPRVRFMCFTDDIQDLEAKILCKSFDMCTQAWRGWWMKGAIFNDHSAEKYIYLDLDTVVTDCLAWLYSVFDLQFYHGSDCKMITLNTENMLNEGAQ